MAGPLNENGLTRKQQAFAEAVARGASISDAYRQAFDAGNMKAATIRKRASELMTRGEVRGLVERLVAAENRSVAVQTTGDREMLLTHLRAWAKGEKDATQVQLRAAELLGKACGLYREVVEDHRERPAQAVAAELEARLAGLMERVNGAGEPDQGSSADQGSSGEQGDTYEGEVGPGEPVH